MHDVGMEGSAWRLDLLGVYVPCDYSVLPASGLLGWLRCTYLKGLRTEQK